MILFFFFFNLSACLIKHVTIMNRNIRLMYPDTTGPKGISVYLGHKSLGQLVHFRHSPSRKIWHAGSFSIRINVSDFTNFTFTHTRVFLKQTLQSHRRTIYSSWAQERWLLRNCKLKKSCLWIMIEFFGLLWLFLEYKTSYHMLKKKVLSWKN